MCTDNNSILVSSAFYMDQLDTMKKRVLSGQPSFQPIMKGYRSLVCLNMEETNFLYGFVQTRGTWFIYSDSFF